MGMKFILGKKIGMTQIFLANGEVVPITKIIAGPCFVTLIKENKKDHPAALQLGFDEMRAFRMNQPKTGQLKGLPALRYIREFAVDKTDNINRGDVIAADTFSAGDIVDVIGVSKGRGFSGVVKRHHFKGGPASHGHKDNLRAPGSIGAGGVQRVFKGMRMAGRLGGDRVTVKNLEIMEVRPDTNEIFIKGAVPGGRNGYLMLLGKGELKVKQAENKIEPIAVVKNTEPIEGEKKVE